MHCIEVGTIIYASVKNIEATSVAPRERLVHQDSFLSKGFLHSRSLIRLSKGGRNNIMRAISCLANEVFTEGEPALTLGYSIDRIPKLLLHIWELDC